MTADDLRTHNIDVHEVPNILLGNGYTTDDLTVDSCMKVYEDMTTYLDLLERRTTRMM